MPKWLRGCIRSADLRTHFIRALLLALVLRSLSAWFVYGPQALDDYKHGVYPAYQLLAGLPLDLPDYRSHLLVWLLAGFARVASWFGVESALGQVRAMYFGLGAVSLLGLVGAHFYARVCGSRSLGVLLLYMTAAYPLMPFVSTRAFGESVALAFVLLGFGVLEWARSAGRGGAWWTAGFLALGAASLFRFHAGILFVVYGFLLVYLRNWRGVLAATIAGALTLAAQALIDVASGKAAFATLFIYLKENEGGAAKYGVSPWYNTWAFAAAILFLPFSAVLLRHARTLWRRQWTLLVPWLAFVAAHSLVAHKEERFLYPIAGLEIWALSLLWFCGAYQRWARRLFVPAFTILGVPLLLVMCFVNTQEGEIEPPALVQRRFANAMYLDHQSLFGISRYQFYFLRPPSELQQIELVDINANRIDAEFEREPSRQAVVVLTSNPDAYGVLRALAGLTSRRGHCEQVRESGSVIDRLLYRLNPKHNQRRRPTWYLICERLSGD